MDVLQTVEKIVTVVDIASFQTLHSIKSLSPPYTARYAGNVTQKAVPVFVLPFWSLLVDADGNYFHPWPKFFWLKP